ncbi:MAG: sulfatase [Geminicoccaceae bacterium]|nr:MAG: sulfatase [Geminicoccaceae bacterium]
MRRADGLALGFGLLLLHLLLTVPNRLDAIQPAAFIRLPIELPLILLALWLAPLAWRPWLARMVGFLAAVVLAIKLADMGAYAALNRPFSLLLDLHLAAASWHLLSGAIGTAATVATALLALGLVLAVAWAIAATLSRLGRVLPAAPATLSGAPSRRAATALALALVVFALSVGVAQTQVLTADTSRLVRDHGRFLNVSLQDLRVFREQAAIDPFQEVPATTLLADLRGRDVLLLFVESYGRSALEDLRYAPTILATLDRFDATLAAGGFHVRSGWVTAPMVGGQSWLAHASILSGLWIDNQRRNHSLMLSDRRTLVHDFNAAGWETVAVMPAITMAWPEVAFFEYDRVYAAADLGYRGEPFNWVTMPDQFTLKAMHRLELDRAPRGPLFVKSALISSHAPWTPIPPVLAWEDIGDGAIFTPYALSGDPPHVVWRDHDRVRAQYLKAVDYSLTVLESFVERFVDDDALVIILGDHQPSPLITGPGASFDVPMHVLSRDAGLIEAIEAWGWTPSMRPEPKAPVWRMDAFRERFLGAFTPSDVARLSAL